MTAPDDAPDLAAIEARAAAAVDAITADLNDRSGCGIDGLDDDIRAEIVATWRAAVAREITAALRTLAAQHAAAEAMREGLACAEWQRLCLASERARGDAARRAATLAETERDTLRALTDSMRADNVRLRGIVESVRSARAVSAAAAERYTAAWDAVGTMPPTPAQSEEIAAALLAAYEAGDALTAALDAAREGR